MRLTLGAILLLMLSAVTLLGCDGGGDELSLKEYYAELSRAQVEAGQRTPSADVDPGDIPADTPPEELRRLLKEGLRASRELNEAFLEDLKSIEPPAEAESVHEDYLAAIDAVGAWIEGTIETVDGVDSLEEFEKQVDLSAYRDIEQGFIEACTELERIAADNGIEVDLECTH